MVGTADGGEPVAEIGLADVLKRVAAAAQRSGRPRDEIVLVAVSKQQPNERIDAALAAGQRVFGENRVQEATTRWEGRRALYDDLELRLIGPLQTNKVVDALRLFDVVESVDRTKLAEKLADAFSKLGLVRRLYVQVNTGEEAQKSGLAPSEVDAALHDYRSRLGLEIEGLMAIPPESESPAPHFALLSKLAERNGLSKLSMGMSGDFETAIALGATSVRVGSAVFGARGAAGASSAQGSSGAQNDS